MTQQQKNNIQKAVKEIIAEDGAIFSYESYYDDNGPENSRIYQELLENIDFETNEEYYEEVKEVINEVLFKAEEEAEEKEWKEKQAYVDEVENYLKDCGFKVYNRRWNNAQTSCYLSFFDPEDLDDDGETIDQVVRISDHQQNRFCGQRQGGYNASTGENYDLPDYDLFFGEDVSYIF